jgi:hypothetical protein
MSTRYRAVAVWVACGALSVATAISIVAGWGVFVYGSAYAIPALAEGRTLISGSSAVSVGDLSIGDRKMVSFDLINLDDRPVSINGMGVSCTCVQEDQLPMEIPPRSRRRLRLSVRPLPKQAGQPFLQKINLYSSTPGPPVSVVVQGRVLKQAVTP